MKVGSLPKSSCTFFQISSIFVKKWAKTAKKKKMSDMKKVWYWKFLRLFLFIFFPLTWPENPCWDWWTRKCSKCCFRDSIFPVNYLASAWFTKSGNHNIHSYIVTTSMVQGYIVHHWPALCTTILCCTPLCKRGPMQIKVHNVHSPPKETQHLVQGFPCPQNRASDPMGVRYC